MDLSQIRKSLASHITPLLSFSPCSPRFLPQRTRNAKKRHSTSLHKSELLKCQAFRWLLFVSLKVCSSPSIPVRFVKDDGLCDQSVVKCSSLPCRWETSSMTTLLTGIKLRRSHWSQNPNSPTSSQRTKTNDNDPFLLRMGDVLIKREVLFIISEKATIVSPGAAFPPQSTAIDTPWQS